MSRIATFTRLSSPEPPIAIPDGTPPQLRAAVVLGGSVAGLITARVLSEHAQSVVIIERDDPGTSVEPRPGVPHGSQIHLLLPGGQVQLERWFPGFTGQAIAAGACLIPPAGRRFYAGDVRRRHDGAQTTMLSGTRPFFEALIRQRTLARPNVKTIAARATGLEFAPDEVTGVHYESDGEPGLQEADFVVDAMGRSSRLSQWLAEAGWQQPPVLRIKVPVNYATALFRHLDGDPDVDAVAWSPSDPSSGVKGALMNMVEGERWTVVISAYGDNHPGRTTEDFIRTCQTELPPEFGAIADSGRLSAEIARFRQADNRRRDFSELTRMPARLVAVGDAVASFNPMYGQGITAAAMHAAALSEYLRSRPDLSQPARRFLKLQKVVVDAAWEASASLALALPFADGPYPRGSRQRLWIRNQVRAATFYDQRTAQRFSEVNYMLRHPSSLYAPATVARALLVNLRTAAVRRGRRKSR